MAPGHLSHPAPPVAAFRDRITGAGVTISRVGSSEQLKLLLFQALTELRGPVRDRRIR